MPREPGQPARDFGPGRPAPGGFTLIELIVVIVLLAVLAGAVIPRLGSTEGRRASAEARGVADLVRALAQRAPSSGQDLSLRYAPPSDGRDASFILETRRRGAEPSRRPPEWTPDPFSAPAAVSLLTLRSARADGVPLGSRGWRVSAGALSPAPEIVLEFSRPRGEPRPLIVVLPRGGMDPVVTAGEFRGPAEPAAVIDLDQAGQGERPW